ncbi:MAG: thioredoxin family protein [Burkholderiales bacterium]|nr:MAG: thioredoxin family protein [Burkholderiales bacterium]
MTLNRRHLLGLGAGLPLGLLLPGLSHAARIGQAAPDFTLEDTAGRPVRLSGLRGKPVVLEWLNPGCPFVRKHYQGNMQALQAAYTAKGVSWLAINSTHDASTDYLAPPQLGRWMQEHKAAATATLMDEDGLVGAAYAARVTPHMYIIDAQGTLVYAGAIDSIPSARVADIERATNYVRQGLDELLAGKPLSQPTSQAYGCSIKYKNGPA